MASFRNWASKLPDWVEVTTLQLPGRGTRMRETPYIRLTPAVQEAFEGIEPLLDRPFSFFGHSLGALLGYELARKLHDELGLQPGMLWVSGRGAPQLPSLHPPIYHLPDALFIERLRSFNGTPAEVMENRELMALFLPILKADFAMNEVYTYQPSAVLSCPIQALGGLQDERTTPDRLQAWSELTEGEFTLAMFPGGHFYLLEHEVEILQLVGERLLLSWAR